LKQNIGYYVIKYPIPLKEREKMKIVSNILPETVRKIQELIDKQAYKDFDEFVRISVENQLGLESSIPPEPTVSLMSNSISSDYQYVIDKLKLGNNNSLIVEMPEPKFEDLKYPNVIKEEDMWIWGQINKVFPIKFSIRYLFNLLKDGKENIELEEFYRKVCNVGRDFGILLAKYDDENNGKRDERLSTGFPVGEEKSKTFARFCSQFVGYKRSDGVMAGALFVLKFANLRIEKNSYKIGLTRSGLQFAKIKNPILDENSKQKSLSDEEVSYYLNHITKKVPGEANTFFVILDIINKGIKEREGINNKLKEFIPNTWSYELINTQRAGAMSRLYQLGLITKNKYGIFVEYDISEKGKEYLVAYNKK